MHTHGEEHTRLKARDTFRAAVSSIAGTIICAVYYGAHPRHTGLLGQGCGTVWRHRLFPRTVPPREEGRPVLWLHASGPGDARATVAFTRALKALLDNANLLITCTTKPAFQHIVEALKHEQATLTWLPFDIGWITKRFVREVRPQVFVCMQGELWPSLLHNLKHEGVPVVMLRMDMFDWNKQREFPKWSRAWYEYTLSLVDVFSTRDPLYRQRLLDLQVPADRIVDGADYRPGCLPAPDDSLRQHCLSTLGISGKSPLVVVASSREDEIGAAIEALSATLRAGRARLLIAPAIQDVMVRVERRLHQLGFSCARWSEKAPTSTTHGVTLLDTHGELFGIYAAADLVLVGDSFPPSFSAGVNLWEPLIQGSVVLYGPELARTEGVALAETAGIAFRLDHLHEIERGVMTRLAHAQNRQAIRSAALDIVANAPRAAQIDAVHVTERLRLP